jgi:hypothetical protein
MRTTTEQILREQLSYAHTSWESYFKHCATIKNWCVTIWLAVLVAIFTEQVELEKWGSVFITASPAFLFWFLESLCASGLNRFADFQKRIEKKIANSDLLYNEPSDIMFVSWLHSTSLLGRARTHLKVACCTENIVLFYSVLIAFSTIFILKFHK